MKRQYGTVRFNELKPGEVSVGVPVVEGAIQIGTNTIAMKEKARLRVIIELGEIIISREDGLGLQVDVVSLDDRGIEARSRVFAQPIAHLILSECIETGDWIVVNEPEVVPKDPDGLSSFLGCVAEFAVEKQDRETANAIIADAMAELMVA